jgi:hypothetical protein
MINLRTKKGDSKLLSIWWFAVLVVIAVGIVASVLIFYSNKTDVRVLESNILTDRISDCILLNGKINNDFINSGDYIFNNCGLNKKIITESTLYYVKISLLNKDNTPISGFPLIFGNNDFDKSCLVGDAIDKAVSFPKCSERQFNVFYNGQEVKLIIKVGSNNEYKPVGVSK